MKHIIETSKEIQNLERWRTTAQKYKETDVILFCKMNKSMRSGEYAHYVIVRKEKRWIELEQIK